MSFSTSAPANWKGILKLQVNEYALWDDNDSNFPIAQC